MEPDSIPDKGEQVDSDEGLIFEKLQAAKGASTERLGGAGNAVDAAEITYHALFDQDGYDWESLPQNTKFPKRTENLSRRLTRKTAGPKKEEFIKTYVSATTKAPFAEALIPDADTANKYVELLAQHGSIVLWTQGDVFGVPEKGLEGSMEQVKKIVIGGFNRTRHKIADKKSINPKDVLSVAISEDKFDCLEQVSEEFKSKGIRKVVILEDRLENLVRAEQMLTEKGIEVFPVWVRQGRFKDVYPDTPERSQEEWMTRYHGVPNMEEALSVLERSTVLEKEVGFLVDFDGIFSDDKARLELQTQAVVQAIKEKGWV